MWMRGGKSCIGGPWCEVIGGPWCGVWVVGNVVGKQVAAVLEAVMVVMVVRMARMVVRRVVRPGTGGTGVGTPLTQVDIDHTE